MSITKNQALLNYKVASLVFGAVFRVADETKPEEKRWMVDQGEPGKPWWVFLACHIDDPMIWGPCYDQRTGCPYFTTDPTADYSVLVRVKRTWDDVKKRRWSQMLVGLWMERADGEIDTSMSNDELAGSHLLYESGDYGFAAVAVLEAAPTVPA